MEKSYSIKEFNNLSAVAFVSDNNNYIYDSVSNIFFKVSPIIIDLLDDVFVLNLEEIKNKHKNKYNATDIDNALNEIENIKKDKRVLLPFNISKFTLSSEEDPISKITQKLDNSLVQLILNVTEKCNLRCEYCIYSGQYYKRRTHNIYNDIPWNIVKRSIDFFVPHSFSSKDRFISFYGGEPLIKYELIKKAIEYVKKINPSIWFSITTNGTLLNENIVEYFEKNNVSLTISLDGPKEIHDRFRKFSNGRGSFNLVYNNIMMIKKKFPKYYLSRLDISAVNVPHEYPPEEINKFFSDPDFVTSINPRRLYMGIISPDKNNIYEKYNYIKHLENFMSKMYMLYEKYHLKKNNLSEIILARSLLSRVIRRIHFRQNKYLSDYTFYWPNGLCIPGMRSLFVSSDGSFYPCEKFYDENDLCIGDVYNGFYYNKIAQLVQDYCNIAIEDCRKCWAYRFCGACFLSIRENNNFNVSKRKAFCNKFRKTLIIAFSFYCSVLEKNKEAFEYLKTEPDNINYVKEMLY